LYLCMHSPSGNYSTEGIRLLLGIKNWNKIPNEFKTLSKDSLNKQMKTSLFQIPDNEDSYLDAENVSSKFKDCIIKTN